MDNIKVNLKEMERKNLDYSFGTSYVTVVGSRVQDDELSIVINFGIS
jgi:hypothetical protein